MQKRIVRFEDQRFVVICDGLVPRSFLRKLDRLLKVPGGSLSGGRRCEEKGSKQPEHHYLTAYQSTQADDAFPGNQFMRPAWVEVGQALRLVPRDTKRLKSRISR